MITVPYNRPVCHVASDDDAWFIAQSYEAWPRTLDELERAEVERDAALNELEPLKARLAECQRHLEDKQREIGAFRDVIVAGKNLRAHLDHENRSLTKERDTLHSALDELTRMLDEFARCRRVPSLFAAWNRYKERP